VTKGKATFRLEGEDATAAAFRSALGRAQGFSKQASNIFKTAFAGLSVAAVAGVAKQAIELGDNLNKAAIKAGVSGQAISELAFSAGQADIDLASLSNSLRFMQTNLSKAASGSKEANNVLSVLGLTLADIKSLDADRQFELIADRISQLRDPADRARAAVELFGRSGAELLPLFEQGAEGIRKAREEAQRLGASLTDQQIAKLAEADDAIKKLSQSWQNFAARLTSFVAPAITATLDALSGASFSNEDRLRNLRAQLDSIKDGYDEATKARLRLEIGQLESQAALDQQRAVGAGGPSRRRAIFSGSFSDEAAKDAAAAGKKVVEAFELDPETLDRIAFEDWKRQTIDNMDEVIRAGADMEDELSEYADQVAENWSEASDSMSVFADQAARNMQSAFADFLFDPFQNGIKGMLKGFVDILRRMVAEAAAAKVFEALGFGSGGGGGGGIGDLLGKLFGGFGGGKVLFPMPRALGGPVTAGSPYLVGERGPELFVPGSSGGIIPNNRMGGASIVVNNNIDARGATSELINALPEILRRNNAQVREEIIEGLRRGRY
jgi:hypothetical protein